MERINYNKIEMKFKEMKYLVSGGGLEKINHNKIELKFSKIELKFIRDEIPCFWWRNTSGKRFLLKSYSGIRGVYYG